MVGREIILTIFNPYPVVLQEIRIQLETATSPFKVKLDCQSYASFRDDKRTVSWA